MTIFTTPQGTRDLMFKECKSLRNIQTQLRNVFDHWGYEEIMTPMVEYYDTFTIAQMKETEVYKILDASNRIETLRADMTIPIARVAATKCKDETMPLRFQYFANVFKVKEELSGHQNESIDCGIELLGVEEPYGDLEILLCALDALCVLKPFHYTLEIGNLNFFKTACDRLSLDAHTQDTLADLINRKSLKALNDYIETLNLDETGKRFFKHLPWLCGDKSILQEAYHYAFHEDLKQILDLLNQLCDQMQELGYHEHITIDLGKIPRMKYYTGLIFEAFVEGVGVSILSGGRYDHLLQRFGKNLPAVGFAIRIDALIDIIQAEPSIKRMEIQYPPKCQMEALKLAQSYRNDRIVILQINSELDEIKIKEGV